MKEASGAERLMSIRRREEIPVNLAIVFEDMSNEALLRLSQDEIATDRNRAYAGWELDYRAAHGIDYFWRKETADGVPAMTDERREKLLAAGMMVTVLNKYERAIPSALVRGQA